MTQTSPSDRQAVFDTAMGSQAAHALRDFAQGFGNVGLWSMIAWRDVKQRYRRSTLGPFWVTISMAFMITGLSIVYGALFNMELRTYLPFVCLGLITWEFVSRSILEGSAAFVQYEGLMKQIRLPLSIHIAGAVGRNAIVLAHNAILYLVVIAIFGINPGWQVLWVLPGFALVLLNLLWAAALLAVICTRFRDVPLILQSVFQMLFFLTPVFWSPTLMPTRTLLVEGNPFYHMLELLRAPLLGHTPEPTSWVFLLITLVAGWSATFWLFSKFRRRVPYWL